MKMKKIYLLSGLALSGVLAYLFLKPKKENAKLIDVAPDEPNLENDKVLETASVNSSMDSTVVSDDTEEAKFYLDKFNDLYALWREENKVANPSKGFGKPKYIYPPYYNHSTALNPCVVEPKPTKGWKALAYAQKYGSRKNQDYIPQLNEYLCRLESFGYVYSNGNFIKGSVLR